MLSLHENEAIIINLRNIQCYVVERANCLLSLNECLCCKAIIFIILLHLFSSLTFFSSQEAILHVTYLLSLHFPPQLYDDGRERSFHAHEMIFEQEPNHVNMTAV